MKYKIEIKETLSRIIEIEAESEVEAIRKVKDDYYEEKVVLNSEDCIEREFMLYHE